MCGFVDSHQKGHSRVTVNTGISRSPFAGWFCFLPRTKIHTVYPDFSCLLHLPCTALSQGKNRPPEAVGSAQCAVIWAAVREDGKS